MPQHILTPGDQKYIRQNFFRLSSRDLAKAIGCSKTAVRHFLLANSLKPSAEAIKAFRSAGLSQRTTCTPEQDEIIRQHYLTMPIKALGKKIGKSYCGIMGRLKQLGLTIPPDIISQNKLVGRFNPGHVSAAKGKPMSDKAYEILKDSMFKKGQAPPNMLYDGAIVIRKGNILRKNKDYKWIRIANRKWEMLHVYLWEQENGPTPEGHMILFKDGDTMNCILENLKCITKQEHIENTRDSDGYLATLMSLRKGARGRVNESLREELLKNKDLIDLKRQSLKLKKEINDKRKKV